MSAKAPSGYRITRTEWNPGSGIGNGGGMIPEYPPCPQAGDLPAPALDYHYSDQTDSQPPPGKYHASFKVTTSQCNADGSESAGPVATVGGDYTVEGSQTPSPATSP